MRDALTGMSVSDSVNILQIIALCVICGDSVSGKTKYTEEAEIEAGWKTPFDC